ncbi:LOB domain-containing protein 4-like [Cornus florida]|uniref:LOB domain-containing protein 4-like n=1 Tax=Cornus florida TaxID=4283 RepID=UPI0028A140CC|nr:LOB domain-containing protein 4-like [Cornus florida]
MGSVGRNRINTPCAACKLLRRRCTEDCTFLPYFPHSKAHDFAAVHRIFGASNVCKMLQEIPAHDRGDAAISIVYEAKARLKDPVYGCVALIASLQSQVFQLQSELNTALSEAMAIRAQQSLSLLMSSEGFLSAADMPKTDLDYHQPMQRDCTTQTPTSFAMPFFPQVIDSVQAITEVPPLPLPESWY